MEQNKATVFVLIFLACWGRSFSQEKDYHFDQFPEKVVLSHNAITEVLQDHNGFLWLGTWSGLMKYDGYEVKQYKQEPGNINGLESNKIGTLFEDSRHQLWVGTQNSGLYRYDRAADRFIQYKQQANNMNSLSDNNVWAIYEDSFGYFWIGTEKGLNLFLPEEEQFIHFTHRPNDSRSISHDYVYTIREGPDRALWIGTGNGLNRLVRKENGEPEYFVPYSLHPERKSIKDHPHSLHNYVYQIKNIISQPNWLWIGTKGGLKKFHPLPDNFLDYELISYQNDPADPNRLSNNFILDMVEDHDHHLWVATLNGLNQLDISTGKVQRFVSDGDYPNVLSNNSIKGLFIDHSDNLWVGTEGGLHRLDLSPKAFTTLHPDIRENVNNQVISSIKIASGGKGLWLGTRGGGLNYLPIEGNEMKPGAFRNFRLEVPNAPETAGIVSDIFVDHHGYLWVTTLGSGVIRLAEKKVLAGDSETVDLLQYPDAERLGNLDNEHLMTITGSRSGDIWIGAWDKGLLRYDRKNDRFINYKTSSDFRVNLESFPNVQLMELWEDGRASLWVGTRGGGLLKFVFDRENGLLQLTDQYQYQIDQPNGISNNFINCLFQDSRGNLWIGTENGLNRWIRKTNTFEYILEKDGLDNATIQSILEDQDGRLWISTQMGISRISPDESASGYHIKNFDPSYHLKSNFFLSASSAALPSGELLFGGANGMTSFNPQKIRLDTIPPKVVISQFRLFNRAVPTGKRINGRIILHQSIGETKTLTLNHEENVISFEFVGLRFNHPKKLKYAHQLEGFDKDWIYTDADQRMAHYTNLPFDDFVFKVKVANSDGFWSEPVSLQLSIKPPFWLTGWAYLLYLLLFATLLYGAYKIIKTRASLQHSLQLERLDREKLEEVNQMKLNFFTNISHELRTPLTLIISPLEQWIKEQKSNRKLHNSYVRMYYNANRLLTMINQLLDIRKTESGLMKLKVAEGNLVKFVREVVLSFKGLARQRKILLKFHSPSAALPVWFDRDQFEKVLFNLLSNAFKFTPEEGRISVTLYEGSPGLAGRAGQVILKVEDNGKGIPIDQLPFVFDRFYQVEQGKEKARQGGTGIGLALVKTIIEQHHGKIWVESRENAGSTFFVSLWKGESHFNENEKIPGFRDSESISQYLIAEKMKGDLEGDPLKITETEGPSKSSEKKPAILIVEDNPDIRSYLRENLEKNYAITEAENGEEGWQAAIREVPDLILADIAMPVMDGIEMCGKIKSDIHTSHIPVILLTARTSLIFKVDGLETGADDYVTKPFSMRLLSIRIKNLIDSRRKLKENFAKNFDLSPSGLVMNSLDEKFLNQVKKVIDNNIDDSDFSVEQLASSLFMNRMQLYRKLKALSGKSPNKVIRSFRLKRAAQLLETRQYNVSDVTYMVGYNDLKSFREQFKKEFGQSPSEYVT